jgi:predicted phosphohydrolase
MKVFALSDPHLAFSTPDKSMDRFGDVWIDHPRKIKINWENTVSRGDIVLVPGDISWAKKFDQALADLYWLDNLPGKKIILKGNHDYWWPKTGILNQKLPQSIYIIKNNCLQIGSFVFFGARLWDTLEYSCDDIVDWDLKKGDFLQKKSLEELKKQEKIYDRELHRLELSISMLPDNPELIRIGMCHFPPLNGSLTPSRASELFSRAGAVHTVFGHLHSLKAGISPFGILDKTEYHLTSGDFLEFKPKLICASD